MLGSNPDPDPNPTPTPTPTPTPYPTPHPTPHQAEGGEGSWSARLLRLRPAHIEAAAAAVHCSAAYVLRVLRLSAEGAPPPSAPVQLASSMQLLGAGRGSSPRRSATQPRGG